MEILHAIWNGFLHFTFSSWVSVIFSGSLLIAVSVFIHKSALDATSSGFGLLLGMMIGACASLLLIPYSAVDRGIFGGITKVIGSLFALYLVVRLQRVFDAFVFTGPTKDQVDKGALKYCGVFVAGIVIAALPVIVCRVEWLDSAAQCRPGFYGATDAQGKPVATDFVAEACEKIGMRYPSKSQKPLRVLTPGRCGFVLLDENLLVIPRPTLCAAKSSKM